jgi:NAD-dependent deacetylase
MSVWGTEDLHQESCDNNFCGPFKIRKDTKITVLSGAGISAESGIPTFRGPDGLWNDEEFACVATPHGFMENPKRGWEFYDARRVNMAQCNPNPAHKAFARLEEEGYDVVVITQNIDRLHQRAGSKRVVELHGTVWEIRCSNPACESKPFENTEVPLKNIPPICEVCGEVLRPHVVFFEEMLDPVNIKAADKRSKESDIFFVVGTSGLVYPAAGFAQVALVYGSHLVELNLSPTPLSSMCDLCVLGPVGETLPKLLTEMTDGTVNF